MHPATRGRDHFRRRLSARADEAEAGEFSLGPILMAQINSRRRDKQRACGNEVPLPDLAFFV